MTLPPRLLHLALPFFGAFAVAGCQSPVVTETSVLSQAFLAPELPDRPRVVYCYRTLGVADCHAHPAPRDEQTRIIEYQGPPPALTAR